MELKKGKVHPLLRLLAHAAAMAGIVLILGMLDWITEEMIVPVCMGYVAIQLVIFVFRR